MWCPHLDRNELVIAMQDRELLIDLETLSGCDGDLQLDLADAAGEEVQVCSYRSIHQDSPVVMDSTRGTTKAPVPSVRGRASD